MNRVMLVAGPSGSGKSVVARVLARAGFQVFELSRGIQQLLPTTPLSFEGRLSHLSKIYAASSGRVLIDLLLRELRAAFRTHPVAIVGVRQVPEIEVIRAELFPPSIIAVYAPAAIRFGRVGGRARPDAPASFDQFLKLTFWEYSLGLARIMYEADVLLENSASEDDFDRTCTDLLAKGFPPAL